MVTSHRTESKVSETEIANTAKEGIMESSVEDGDMTGQCVVLSRPSPTRTVRVMLSDTNDELPVSKWSASCCANAINLWHIDSLCDDSITLMFVSVHSGRPMKR